MSLPDNEKIKVVVKLLKDNKIKLNPFKLNFKDYSDYIEVL